MKILMVSHYFEEHCGGVEIFAGCLARKFTVGAREICWLAIGDHLGGSNGVRKEKLRAWNFVERRLGLPYLLLFPSAFRQIFRAVGEADVVLVHDGFYLTSITATIATRWCRKPLVVIQHTRAAPYKSAVLRFLVRLANRLVGESVLAAADRVTFVSTLTQSYFKNVRIRHKLELIFNGVDMSVFQLIAPMQKSYLKKKFDVPADGRIVLFVGRFVEIKGLHIMERMARKRPHLLFAFAGWGPLDPTKWGLPNVRVFENLSGKTLAPLYQASDVLLLPSVGEGFPLVVQEALACGLPVVCGADTALADPAASPLLNGVELGVPVEAAAAAVGVAMDAALGESDPQGAARRRADFAALHYSWDSVIDRYENLLTSLTKAEAADLSTCGSAP